MTRQAPSPTQPRHIVVGDDHPLVQTALRTALTSSFPGTHVSGCLDLEAVLRTVGEAPDAVDLVLLDLNMPGSNGFTGLFLMLAHFPTVPVAILSAAQEPATIRRAIAYGASGYIPKSLALPEMIGAVTAILDGAIWTPPGSSGRSDVSDVDDAAARRFASLSAQQLRILTMVVDGMLNKQIAAELGISEQTVKMHVSTIFKKLGVSTRTQAAIMADRLDKL